MILDRYVLKQFTPVFFIALFMFALLIIMIDLFTYLVRYLNNDVSAIDIVLVSFYYIPKSISYAFPISLLFASAYTLGDLYAKNELTSIFTSGITFRRFILPLLLIGISSSFFAFFFNDIIVIPTYKMKNDLNRTLLNQQSSDYNRTDVVIRARQGRLTYVVDYFDHAEGIINGVSIIEFDENGNFMYQIRARSAVWTGSHWELFSAVIYEWNDNMLRFSNVQGLDTYRESPETFRRNMVNVEELGFIDAGLLVKDLQAAGMPFLNALTDYHHRLSFASVSFVVILLSVSMGGRFKKNIMLMSLLSSLGGAVIYYVIEMLSMLMARTGYISPITGAWFPVFIFILIGAVFITTAKT